MEQKRDFRVIIGQNLQYLRKKYALTQAMLAEKLEISISHIANIERAESSVSISLLQRITELFKVTPNDLLLENIEESKKNPKSREEEFREKISNKVTAFEYSLYSDFVEFYKNEKFEKVNTKKTNKTNPKESYTIKHSSKTETRVVADKEKNN